MPPKKIALLAGGFSSEREISIRSGENLYKALTKAGFETTLLDPADPFFNIQILKSFDLVYPILHGTKGEDGCIQGMLEILNIPYVGCGVLASSLTMDKAMTKKVFRSLNISCPKGFVASNNMQENLKQIAEIGYPIFIKPTCEGSSVGSLILHNKEETELLLENHLKQYPYSLIEELLIGREMTVGLFEQNKKIVILPVLELKPPKDEFYTYENKYTPGMTKFILPAPIDPDILIQIHKDVLTIFKEFQLKDCVRIDLLLTQQGPVYLEINSAPGMTNTSDIPAMLEEVNIPLVDFVSYIINNNIKERITSC